MSKKKINNISRTLASTPSFMTDENIASNTSTPRMIFLATVIGRSSTMKVTVPSCPSSPSSSCLSSSSTNNTLVVFSLGLELESVRDERRLCVADISILPEEDEGLNEMDRARSPTQDMPLSFESISSVPNPSTPTLSHTSPLSSLALHFSSSPREYVK